MPRSLDELRRSEAWTTSALERPGLEEDPWGRKYRLADDGGACVLTSLGADGREGGEGEDEDVEAFTLATEWRIDDVVVLREP